MNTTSKELKNSRKSCSLPTDIEMENVEQCILNNDHRRNLYNKISNDEEKEVILFIDDDNESDYNIEERQSKNEDILLKENFNVFEIIWPIKLQ